MKKVEDENLPDELGGPGVWERRDVLYKADGRWFLGTDDRWFYELTTEEAIAWMCNNSYNGLVEDVLKDFFPELLPALARVWNNYKDWGRGERPLEMMVDGVRVKEAEA